MPPKNRFAELLPEITAWRRDFHEHPELLFDVHRTAARVADLCRSFGCDEVVEGIGRTGVVAVIKGRTDSKGRVVGLRADMDALPIKEQTGVPYASKTPGKMHACGHDGHTAMLLGAAKYLAETRNFDGTVVCIFQPAEEGGGGGREMVRDGMLTRWNVQEVYGMHNMPGIPVGHFAIRPGPLMAAADQFEIVVTGKGGHAAKPHDCVDTTVVSAHIIVALQTIASRNVDPLKQIVVSLCTVETDSTAHNVIPAVAKARISIRFNDTHSGASLSEKVVAIAKKHGGTALPIVSGEPFLTPPGEFSAIIADAVKAETGVDPEPSTTGGTSDARFLRAVCPVIEFGLVNATMHKRDEAVAVEDLHVLTRIYARIVKAALA